jgi:DNA invertase Pin-like site-specific DNA recombinase
MRLLLAARLSTKQANGQDGIGIETQDEYGRDWAERQDHEVIAVAAGTAKGTVAPWDRKYLRTWLTDPDRLASYDGILCYATDRLSRGDQEDFTRIEAWATANGKCLVIAGGDGIVYPARDDSDYWQWAATKRQARKEWESIRERITRNVGKLRDQGKFVGRYPWGYSSAGEKYDRRMVTTAEGERYVPEVFTRTADGHTLSAVAAWLTGQTGKTWHPRVVAAMIRNRSYMGKHTDATGKTIHECPALVDGDLWRRANANLDGRPSSRRGQRNDLVNGAAMLSGLVYCGNPDCTAGPDSPMCKSNIYYRCTGRGAQRRGCGVMVPMADADALMNANMSGLRLPVLRPVFHPATGHQVELDDITQTLRDLPAQGLDDDAEDDERARLRAERKRLMGLPAKPAWTERVPVLDANGQPITYGDKWQVSGQAERRRWLKDDAGFRAYLGRPGMVAADDDDYPDEAFHRVEAYATDRAVLTFLWAGDADPGLARGLA